MATILFRKGAGQGASLELKLDMDPFSRRECPFMLRGVSSRCLFDVEAHHAPYSNPRRFLFSPTSGVRVSLEIDVAKERLLMKIPSIVGFCAKWCGPVSLLIVLCFPGQFLAQSPPLTPGDVVQLWLTVYPDNLDRAANMTTLNFRQGIPRLDWVDAQDPILRGLRLKYGQGRILYEDIQGNEARVILRVPVSSWMGSAIKDELYSLVKGEEGLWFIDRVEEYVPNTNQWR